MRPKRSSTCVDESTDGRWVADVGGEERDALRAESGGEALAFTRVALRRATTAPSAAKRSAIARPMPRPAPVTRATFARPSVCFASKHLR